MPGGNCPLSFYSNINTDIVIYNNIHFLVIKTLVQLHLLSNSFILLLTALGCLIWCLALDVTSLVHPCIHPLSRSILYSLIHDYFFRDCLDSRNFAWHQLCLFFHPTSQLNYKQMFFYDQQIPHRPGTTTLTLAACPWLSSVFASLYRVSILGKHLIDYALVFFTLVSGEWFKTG